jgi:benzoyl-CoA reductase/2-hydroxyglutaryl-CoA dehydratase subunit BcrC/BadD/HgdB
VVFVNSCDAMRRLADAWRTTFERDRVAFLDLPMAADERSVGFLAAEISRLKDVLTRWSGRSVTAADLEASFARYNQLADSLQALRVRHRQRARRGGAAFIQSFTHQAMTEPLADVLARLPAAIAEFDALPQATDLTPVYLFGNVLPDPEMFAFFESCGANIAGDDLCTSGRAFARHDGLPDLRDCRPLARGLLARPPCARTVDAANAGRLAEDVADAAKACGARGVIAHFMKFCDPYLARLPAIRTALQEAGLPLLALEGDCTLRSLGQQRTRVEAFVEMLG